MKKSLWFDMRNFLLPGWCQRLELFQGSSKAAETGEKNEKLSHGKRWKEDAPVIVFTLIWRVLYP